MTALRLVLTGLALVLAAGAAAQEYQYRIYNEADGLSHPFTYAVFKDSRGYLWIGSENGVSRFDGRRFVNYYRDEQELTTNYVLTVNEYLGRLIIGTYGGGICYFDEYEDRFIRVHHPDIPRDVKRIYVQHGRIFLVDRDLELHIGDSTGKLFRPGWLTTDAVYQVCPYGNTIYLCTRDGLLRCHWQPGGDLVPADTLLPMACYGMALRGDTLFYTTGTGLWMRIGAQAPQPLWPYAFNHVHQGAIIADMPDQVSFATADTFYTLHTTKRQIISRIFQVSASGTAAGPGQPIWIASYGKGVYQLNRNYPVAYFSALNNNASRRTIVTRIIGTGDTLAILHKRGIEGIPVAPPVSYNRTGSNDFIFRDLYIRQKAIYTAVYENSLNNVYDPQNRLIFSTRQIIYLLCGSSDGSDLYIGAGDGFYIFDTKSRKLKYHLLDGRRVFDMSRWNGLWYIATNTGAYTWQENHYEEPQLADTNRCWKVIPLNDTLLISANDEGLRICHPRGAEHYMRTLAIYDLAVQPGNNCLFIATNQGLFAVWQGLLKPVDLVASSSHIPVFSLHITGDRLWAGTTDGLYGLDIAPTLQALFRPDQHIPLYLAGYTADNEYRRPEGHIRLPASRRNLALRFSFPFFQRPFETELCYRVNKGLWTSTNDEQVVLSDVPYGPALIEVFARNRNSVSDTLTISVYREVPLYYRTWFIALVIALTVAMAAVWAYLSYRRRIKLLERKHLERIHQFELENQALFSLMNPHFIFNSLNNIKYFIRQQMLEESSAYLHKFSDLLRLVLETSERKESTLEEELRLLRFYTELENLRFNTKVNILLDASAFSRPEQVIIPSMMLQPFVENALWHAFTKDQQNPELLIRFTPVGETRVEIKIIDNGSGFMAHPDPGKKSLGIALIRKRVSALNALYNGACQLDITSEPGKGATVCIILPRLDHHP